MEINTLPRSSKSKVITEFDAGYQRLLEMPTEAALNAQVPDDRVIVVMPQEKSSRYGEMQLRRRRVDERATSLTMDQVRKLSFCSIQIAFCLI